ncbi:hypothetical protein [Rhodopirellula sallentina]|nr:hypothetical protein [Rhodopirellula sallentina]
MTRPIRTPNQPDTLTYPISQWIDSPLLVVSAFIRDRFPAHFAPA